MPVDKFGRMSDTKTKDTGVSLTYINNNYVRSDGGTPLSGSLDMRFNKLVNLHKPTEQYDAVTKDYVDYIEKEIREKLEKEIREKLEKRTHIISASASYHGDLIAGDYQFTWGGQSVKSYKKHDVFNGFLIPHSGYIKRFVLEDFGLKINPKLTADFINISIPLFTLVVIKNDKRDKIVDLGTLNITFESTFDLSIFGNVESIKHIYTFISNVGDLEKYPLSTKDVLNIRTEFKSEVDKPFNIRKIGYEIKDIENEFYTYLATVLIELDLL